MTHQYAACDGSQGTTGMESSKIGIQRAELYTGLYARHSEDAFPATLPPAGSRHGSCDNRAVVPPGPILKSQGG